MRDVKGGLLSSTGFSITAGFGMHGLGMPRGMQLVGCSRLSLTHKPSVGTPSSVPGSGWAGLLASLLLFLPLQVIGIKF